MDPYKRFILFERLYFGKMWKFSEKRPFFRADMAGLGKYCTGGYGRIGVSTVWEYCFAYKIDYPIQHDNGECAVGGGGGGGADVPQ